MDFLRRSFVNFDRTVNSVLVHEKKTENLKLLRRWTESEEEFDEQLFQALEIQKRVFLNTKETL